MVSTSGHGTGDGKLQCGKVSGTGTVTARCASQRPAAAGEALPQTNSHRRDAALPIPALLTRIRKLIPEQHDAHYDEIARGFCNGTLRPPATPMSDRELGAAIAGFLKAAPSATAVSQLGRQIDPSSPL